MIIQQTQAKHMYVFWSYFLQVDPGSKWATWKKDALIPWTTLTGPIGHILWRLPHQPHWWYRHDWLDKDPPLLWLMFLFYCSFTDMFQLSCWLYPHTHATCCTCHTKPYIISKYVSKSNLNTGPNNISDVFFQPATSCVWALELQSSVHQPRTIYHVISCQLIDVTYINFGMQATQFFMVLIRL